MFGVWTTKKTCTVKFGNMMGVPKVAFVFRAQTYLYKILSVNMLSTEA
jgi:hypothetical protein